jgi:hypothetical protein
VIYYIVYRKHKLSTGNWPWHKYCNGIKSLHDFTLSLGDDYEFRIFKEVKSLAKLKGIE